MTACISEASFPCISARHTTSTAGINYKHKELDRLRRDECDDPDCKANWGGSAKHGSDEVDEDSDDDGDDPEYDGIERF